MNKAKLNFIIDAIAFAAFVLLATTGVLVRYVLPPGSGHFSVLWGMDRHQWGQVHFWIAVVMFGAMVLHLFLHWNWIVCMVKGRPRQGSGLRVGLAIVSVVMLISLAATPFFGRVEQTGQPPHRMRSTEAAQEEGSSINGTMTLAELQQATQIPVALFLRELGLPPNTAATEQLGRLQKKHGFSLQKVRDIARTHKQDQRK